MFFFQCPAYQKRRQYQMHMLKFFLLVFVCFGPQLGSAGTANSSLSLIYNDLSIIARITNAIALQKNSIQKDIKARKVITELLKVQTKSFDELMVMDPKKLMNELETVFNISSEIAKGIVTTGDEFKKIEKFNFDLGYAMNTTLSSDVPGLMNSLKSESFRDKLMICKMGTVKVVVDFVRAMTSASSNDLNQIRALKEQGKEVKECLNSIVAYQTVLNTTVENIYQFKLIAGARGFCNDFYNDFSYFTGFHENILLLKNLATKARTIWKMPRLYERVSKMGQLLETISDHDNEPKPDLCAGFIGVDDTAKVLEDVKSPWFQKEISKGKSTKDLEEALEPFGKFARKLGEFKKIWVKFDGGIRQEGVFAREMSALLDVIENYSGLDNAEKFLEEAAASYKKTWNDSRNQPFDAKPLYQFDKKLKTVNEILTFARKIEMLCKQLVKEFDFITLAHVLNEIEKLDLSKSEIKDLQEAINGVNHYDTLRGFFKDFVTFSLHQTELNNLHGSLGDDFTTIVADGTAFIKNSSFSQMLNARSYDTLKFDETLQFFRKLMKFDDSSKKEAKNHFETFENLKNEYFKLEEFVKSLGSTSSALIVNFRNASNLAHTYGRGVHVFRDITEAYERKDAILKSISYDKSVNDFIDQIQGHEHLSKFWGSYNRDEKMNRLLEELVTLEKSMKPFVSKDFETLRQALNTAVNVTGLRGFEYGFRDILDQLSIPNRLNKTYRDPAIENSKQLADLDLDFSSHRGDLLAASMSFDNIREEFNTMFGLNPKNEKTVKNEWLVVVIISVGVFLLLVIGVLLIYGLTERGRNQYKNLYLFYFGKPEDFDKRWRYSLFMDRKDGKNALMDATREIHAINVEKEAKRGAFIDFYNEFGNTALHLSSKRGYPEIVEVLIKNGADRSLVNYQNRTPEQMIPENYQETYPEKVEKYQKIEAIYRKYRN
ncbi:hypothetical protein CRE_07758, partial [Caenorhabditis remanei]